MELQNPFDSIHSGVEQIELRYPSYGANRKDFLFPPSDLKWTFWTSETHFYYILEINIMIYECGLNLLILR